MNTSTPATFSRRGFLGIAAAAAGLLIATAAKMVVPLFKGGINPAPFVVLAVALAIGVMRWPLLWVMAVLVPVSIAMAWAVRR